MCPAAPRVDVPGAGPHRDGVRAGKCRVMAPPQAEAWLVVYPRSCSTDLRPISGQRRPLRRVLCCAWRRPAAARQPHLWRALPGSSTKGPRPTQSVRSPSTNGLRRSWALGSRARSEASGSGLRMRGCACEPFMRWGARSCSMGVLVSSRCSTGWPCCAACFLRLGRPAGGDSTTRSPG